MDQTEIESLLKDKERSVMELQFVRFITDLTNSGLQFFGRLKNPRTNELDKDLPNAEKMLYLLNMLTEKTKNNLTEMENNHIRNALDCLKRVYYEETELAKAKQKSNDFISIRHILVEFEHEASDARRRILAGEDFAELAKLISNCNSRSDGGYIENIKRGDFPKNIEEVAFKLNKDEISPVIHSVLGFHIVKLVDKQVGKKKKKREH